MISWVVMIVETNGFKGLIISQEVSMWTSAASCLTRARQPAVDLYVNVRMDLGRGWVKESEDVGWGMMK